MFSLFVLLKFQQCFALEVFIGIVLTFRPEDLNNMTLADLRKGNHKKAPLQPVFGTMIGNDGP